MKKFDAEGKNDARRDDKIMLFKGPYLGSLNSVS